MLSFVVASIATIFCIKKGTLSNEINCIKHIIQNSTFFQKIIFLKLGNVGVFKDNAVPPKKQKKKNFFDLGRFLLENDNKIILFKSNQIFHYTRCNTTKRAVTSLRDPSSHHYAQAAQLLLSKKCRSGGESLATARDLNLRPRAQETNALPLDQLAGYYFVSEVK